MYLGGDKPESPKEGKQQFAKYMDWLASLGEAVVSPANPLKDTHLIRPDGSVIPGGQTTMSGYTVIETNSIQAALEIEGACPFLEVNGSLEISELVQMPAQPGD